MRAANLAARYVIAREDNVVRVDFTREPDPPAPRFPGALGLRPREDFAGATDSADWSDALWRQPA